MKQFLRLRSRALRVAALREKALRETPKAQRFPVLPPYQSVHPTREAALKAAQEFSSAMLETKLKGGSAGYHVRFLSNKPETDRDVRVRSEHETAYFFIK